MSQRKEIPEYAGGGRGGGGYLLGAIGVYTITFA